MANKKKWSIPQISALDSKSTKAGSTTALVEGVHVGTAYGSGS